MKFRCEDCGEMILPAKARFCPMCGKTITKESHTASLKDKVIAMYNANVPLRKIAYVLNANSLAVAEIITKKSLETGEIPFFVQTEFETDILTVIPSGPDVELKAIKRLVPAECTYETILYYVKKTHWKYRNERIKRLQARMNELIELQAPIEQIKAEIGSPDYYIEQAILEHIEKNPNKEWRYIQHEYENDILQVVSWIGAEHGLKVFKERLPEDCTYITIKVIFRKHGLEYINGKSLEAA